MAKQGCNFFSRNQTSLVNLQLLRNDKKVDQVVYGREYVLRADISQPDGETIMLQTKSAADLTPSELFLLHLENPSHRAETVAALFEPSVSPAILVTLCI